MGWFIPLLALAAAAAGTGASMAGANKAQREMNQRTLDELARQRGIQRQAEGTYAQSLAQSGKDTAEEQIQTGAQSQEGLYNQLQGLPLSTNGQNVLTATSPTMTLRDVAQMQLANRSRARLGGYETWMLDQAVKNLRAGQELGIFNQAAQRSQQVLPLELQDASHAGDTLQGIGMGLGTLSTLLSLGGTSALGAAGSVAGSGAQMAARPQNGYGWMNE